MAPFLLYIAHLGPAGECGEQGSWGAGDQTSWGEAVCHLRYLAVHAHLKLLLLFGQRHRRMIVQTLGHQLQGQRILRARRLLDFGALVLEPDLDLCLVQAQLGAQLLASSFGEVAILIEFALLERAEERKRERER